MTSRLNQALVSIVLGLIVVMSLAPSPTHGQSVSGGGAGGGAEGRIEGRAKFLPIPYVGYNRSIEFQLGAIPLLMFNPVLDDTLSPSSLVGGFGMYTTNDTWFLMAMGVLFLHQDDWRTTFAGGKGSVNFQFFVDNPVDGWIPYNTEVGIVYLQLQRRLVHRLYGGISYVYLDFKTTIEPLPEEEFPVTLHGIGFDLLLDRRSSVYYPRSGSQSAVTYFGYPEAFGNEYSSDKIELEHNHFRSMRRSHDVLAGRVFVGLGLGDLTFNQQFIVGQQSDIRGYSQGEYRGNYMVALQGEYRWNFRPRLGAVGFVGMATVFDAINEDDNGKPLPAIGAGFRITVDTDTHMNAGLDVAVGVRDWGIYFRIGEAF